jgi:SapB morphogen precursor RamS
MALLDLQGMEPTKGGPPGGSSVSLLLCNSVTSLTLCL